MTTSITGSTSGIKWYLIAIALLAVVGTGAVIAQTWNPLKKAPNVPLVTTAQLREILLDPIWSKQYVVVDVRAPVETSVSVIPGAITVEQFHKTQSAHVGKTVVAYCTVGYRSGKFAVNLVQQGVDARNYKGSILEWCAAGQPLVTPQGEPTRRVHTYDDRYHVPDAYEAVHSE